MKHSRLILLALFASALVKLWLALNTHGSIDVSGFYDQLQKIRALGVGAYGVRGPFDNVFSHPPAMIHIIKFWGWLADSTELPFRFWLRLPSISADIGSFFIVARWLVKLQPTPDHFWRLLALVLCPASIIISGWHGNTDSLMIFLVLLAVYLVETERASWLAGFVFGLSLCVKFVPLIFVPAVFFYLPRWRTRLSFFGAAAATFILCSLPYIAQDPQAVKSVVFGYSSIYGHWGLTLLALLVSEPPMYSHGWYDVQGGHAIFAAVLKYATLGLICALAVWLNRREKRSSFFVQCGLVAAIFLFLTPGFGQQYLAWIVPFVAALRLRTIILFYLSSGLLVLFGGFMLSMICWLVLPLVDCSKSFVMN